MVKNKFKSIRTLRFILTLFILHLSAASGFFSANATVRYVSHEGSNTPPYTTWETAANSIMFAINMSEFGDTIYVANGVYEEQVTMIPGLTLVGAGMDSCVIDTRDFATPTDFFAVIIKNVCLFKGFKIVVSNSNLGTGLFADGEISFVRNNKIKNCLIGIWTFNSNSEVNGNIVNSADRGIVFDASTTGYQPIANNNFIDVRGRVAAIGIELFFGAAPTIKNNLLLLDGEFASGYQGSFSDTVKIFNNLVLANYQDINTQIFGIVNTNLPTFNLNNYIQGNYENGIAVGSQNLIKNNVTVGGIHGISFNSSGANISFNNSWNNNNNYSGFTPDSTNLSLDPMVVNEDSLDFHLQMFSPLIDAGDPNILDIDGSRSDIGLWGGPYGESYTYRDLAPKPPSNLTAVYDSGFVLLRWNRNTEADFYHYRVYRDTVANFIYDTTKIIAVVADTFYYDDLPEKYLQTDYYYKLTAMDSTGHQSATSEEVQVIITGAPEGPPIVLEEYKLLQNYPNPFNPSTIIPYRLIEPGYVKLYVYDIKGELVRILVNDYQTAGYYEVEFRPNSSERVKGNLGLDWATGYNDDIASGIYIYQIMVKSDRNIPVFTDMNKMILLK